MIRTVIALSLRNWLELDWLVLDWLELDWLAARAPRC
jgi:hypothetical protein